MIGIFVVLTVFARPNATTPGGSFLASANAQSTAATRPMPPQGAASTQPAPTPGADAGETRGVAPASAPASAPAAPRPVLRALSEPEARVATLGSLDPKSGFRMEVDLSAYGASILAAHLTDYNVTAQQKTPYPIQSAYINASAPGRQYIFPLAARLLFIEGQWVDLSVAAWKLESPSTYRTKTLPEPGAPKAGPFSEAIYSLLIVDPQDHPVARVRRTYQLDPASYDLRTRQEIINLTDRSLEVVWQQNGAADLPNDDATYMGDHRSFIVGYYDTVYDAARKYIFTEKGLFMRTAVLDAKATGAPTIWPNPALPEKSEPVWFAVVNRYFAVAATPGLITGGAPPSSKPDAWFGPAGSWASVNVEVTGAKAQTDQRQMVTTLLSRPLTIGPRQAARLDVHFYVGPRERKALLAQPWSTLSLDRVIVYQLGCTICTFQFLAHWLLAFLRTIESVTFDWGVSIIVLVLLVRAGLHPLTRQSQIQMARLGKQMQAVKPDLERLKKKYANDQQKLNAEIMALYRTKGINPFNMLGCLPLFLQMPIWVALYAMLYYAIELRHQPAFYGVFQAISGGRWTFLADLSSADHFIQFSQSPVTINLPLLSYLDFSAFNILPPLMAVVFFYQQKLTMPPPADEQAAQQQKIMKWMSVIWPVLLYAAPSGLTLYILASTGAGIVDSYLIRRHLKREEERGELFKPPKPGKPDGPWGRFQKWASERAARVMDEQERRSAKTKDRRDN